MDRVKFSSYNALGLISLIVLFASVGYGLRLHELSYPSLDAGSSGRLVSWFITAAMFVLISALRIVSTKPMRRWADALNRVALVGSLVVVISFIGSQLFGTPLPFEMSSALSIGMITHMAIAWSVRVPAREQGRARTAALSLAGATVYAAFAFYASAGRAHEPRFAIVVFVSVGVMAYPLYREFVGFLLLAVDQRDRSRLP